jgi:hypothetical protein
MANSLVQTFAQLLTIASNHAGIRHDTREALLAAKINTGLGAPAYAAIYAGNHTTVGGAAAEAKTVTGVLSTDIVMATLKAKGATPRTILITVPTTNTITFTFSGDPSTDHVVSYVVFRAKP